MNIEVVLALPGRQELISLAVDADTTVETAISLSAIGDKFPEEDLSSYQTGIWGKLVDRDHPMQDGDRLELVRPLLIDPRDARRQLALSGATMGKAADNVRDPD